MLFVVLAVELFETRACVRGESPGRKAFLNVLPPSLKFLRVEQNPSQESLTCPKDLTFVSIEKSDFLKKSSLVYLPPTRPEIKRYDKRVVTFFTI